MKVGFFGYGKMAEGFARTMSQIEGLELYGVAGRRFERAKEFAKEFNFAKAYESLEDMLKDGKVEFIYIVTPHSEHYKEMLLCIKYRVPVLCEKAFTVNAKQAEIVRRESVKNKSFVAEAIWTRYMPYRKILNDLIDSNIIGKVVGLTANLSYNVGERERLKDPKLAGGSLLDLAVYGINFALMVFGNDVKEIKSTMTKVPTGVDGTEGILLKFADGKIATLMHSMVARSDRLGVIYGEKGYIIVHNVNNPEKIEVFDNADKLINSVTLEKKINGYEFEILECMKNISEGKIEPDSMPLAESVFVMKLMDRIRKPWGLKYPCDKL